MREIRRRVFEQNDDGSQSLSLIEDSASTCEIEIEIKDGGTESWLLSEGQAVELGSLLEEWGTRRKPAPPAKVSRKAAKR